MREDLEIVSWLGFQLARAKQAQERVWIRGSPRHFSHLPDSGHQAPGGSEQREDPRRKQKASPSPRERSAQGRLRAEFAQQTHCSTSTVYLLRLALVGGGVRRGHSLKPPKGNTWHSYSFAVFTVINPGTEEWLLENLPCVRS